MYCKAGKKGFGVTVLLTELGSGVTFPRSCDNGKIEGEQWVSAAISTYFIIFSKCLRKHTNEHGDDFSIMEPIPIPNSLMLISVSHLKGIRTRKGKLANTKSTTLTFLVVLDFYLTFLFAALLLYQKKRSDGVT